MNNVPIIGYSTCNILVFMEHALMYVFLLKKNDLTCNIFTIIVIYLETSSHFIDSYNIEIKKL